MTSQVPLCSVTMFDGHTHQSREPIPVLTVSVFPDARELRLGFSKLNSVTGTDKIESTAACVAPEGQKSVALHLHSIEAGSGQSSERSPRSVM
jgi:hypothetical protein